MLSAKPQLPPYHWRRIHPNATLHYVQDLYVANTLLDSLSGPVGFDLEWRPTFTKNTPENPVAIVQLANDAIVLVIQISEMSEFPTKLREFLENPDIAKAGVAIQNDAKKIYKDCQVSLRNCVDLSLLARCVDNAQWKGKYSAPLGLARLVETYENYALPKGRVARSNWENSLSPREIDYAANDAHAGFVVYQRLSAMANAMDKVPKSTYYSFDFVRGTFCEPSGMHWNCHNPDYDPGPPPAPKEPKQPTARDIRRAQARAAAISNTSLHSVSTSPRPTWDFSHSQSMLRLPKSIQQATKRRSDVVAGPQQKPSLSEPLHPPPTTLGFPRHSTSDPHRTPCPGHASDATGSCGHNIPSNSPGQQDTTMTPTPKQRRRRGRKPVSAS